MFVREHNVIMINRLYLSLLDEKKRNAIEGIQAKTEGNIEDLLMKYYTTKYLINNWYNEP